jgi:hypothetical protein
VDGQQGSAAPFDELHESSHRSGAMFIAHFHASLWLSESHELLVAQGDQGIDAHGAARGNVRCQKRDGSQQGGDGDEG